MLVAVVVVVEFCSFILVLVLVLGFGCTVVANVVGAFFFLSVDNRTFCSINRTQRTQNPTKCVFARPKLD